jgi:hypothetical protein
LVGTILSLARRCVKREHAHVLRVAGARPAAVKDDENTPTCDDENSRGCGHRDASTVAGIATRAPHEVLGFPDPARAGLLTDHR